MRFENILYGFMFGLAYNLLHNRFFPNVGVFEATVIIFISYLLGDYLIVKFDRWRIKRKVRREIIKAIKAQGLNPKDFEIDFGKYNITRTDNPDYDVVKLTYKKTDKNDEA